MAFPGPSRLDRSRVSLPPQSTAAGDQLLRRFSVPSPYSPEPSVLRAEFLSTVEDSHHTALTSSPRLLAVSLAAPPLIEHRYTIQSRGKDYALVTTKSHALNAKDTPTLHLGDEVSGFVTLPLAHLGGIHSIEVVLQEFTPGQVACAVETKRTMMPDNIDPSFVSTGLIHWPFSMMPSVFGSSSSSSSSMRNGSSTSHDSSHTNPMCQLKVTVHRRGRLTQNAVLAQEIRYITPSDTPSLPSSSDSHGVPRNDPPRRNTVSEIPWEEQHFPPVLVKGTLVRRDAVVVECRLVIPVSPFLCHTYALDSSSSKLSYPAGPLIPMKMTLTSSSMAALDLLATSQAIDVRLWKIVAFGSDTEKISPLTLMNRKSYHRRNCAATARWHTDGNALSLPSDDKHPDPRWSVRLHGYLHWDDNIDMSQSFEMPDMAVMYTVCIYPFKAKGFHPTSSPDKELFIGKITLSAPRQ
ncbi:hypothetical protein BV25DRAFT_1089804 [Artomyces pyxidatus]|uniref:Uncharacterized protein n=1 Tax=Artomyces pyxidatus TaxID=48021 RepID=A0ACB8TFS5_9AGAM|nr:hypothetical protein BV25DRAFT_1089804 [Artomyces pyxidatus]